MQGVYCTLVAMATSPTTNATGTNTHHIAGSVLPSSIPGNKLGMEMQYTLSCASMTLSAAALHTLGAASIHNHRTECCLVQLYSHVNRLCMDMQS